MTQIDDIKFVTLKLPDLYNSPMPTWAIPVDAMEILDAFGDGLKNASFNGPSRRC